MKINLEQIWKELGLPVALSVLFAGLLGLLGLSIDQVLGVAAGLFGVAMLIGLIVDVLKWSGVVDEGWAGKVSAALNLAVLAVVAVMLKLYPEFDFSNADEQVMEFARVFAVVFAYITQIVSSKQFHNALVDVFGMRLFRLT